MCAIYLENEFTNLFVEKFPDVTYYCQKFKDLKDQLSTVGQTVSERALVLRLCSSLLDSGYDGITHEITQIRPLPCFQDA